MPLRDHILLTMHQVQRHAEAQGAANALHLLRGSVSTGENDARWLRNRQRREQLLAEVTRQAAGRFRSAVAGN